MTQLSAKSILLGSIFNVCQVNICKKKTGISKLFLFSKKGMPEGRPKYTFIIKEEEGIVRGKVMKRERRINKENRRGE